MWNWNTFVQRFAGKFSPSRFVRTRILAKEKDVLKDVWIRANKYRKKSLRFLRVSFQISPNNTNIQPKISWWGSNKSGKNPCQKGTTEEWPRKGSTCYGWVAPVRACQIAAAQFVLFEEQQLLAGIYHGNLNLITRARQSQNIFYAWDFEIKKGFAPVNRGSNVKVDVLLCPAGKICRRGKSWDGLWFIIYRFDTFQNKNVQVDKGKNFEAD